MYRRRSLLKGWLLGAVVFLAVLAMLIVGLRSARRAQQEESLRVLSESLQRALISCYSIEGRYPDTLEYLTDNYSVYIDTDRYTVHYSVYADNIMPDVTILVNN